MFKKPFIWIRHGETDWNKQNRAQGIADIKLNKVGRKQIKDSIPYLAQQPITIIYTSRLQRAQESARIISKALRVPIVFYDELQEADWGEKTGHNPIPWRTEWIKGKLKLKKGETYKNFTKRILEVLNYILDDEFGGTLPLIVGHGGSYWPIQDLLKLKHELIHNGQPILHIPMLTGIKRINLTT